MRFIQPRFKSKPFDLETSVHDRVVMSSEPDVSLPIVQPFGYASNLGSVKLINVNIEDLRAIECHLNPLAIDLDLLVIPLTNGTQITMLRTDTMIK